MSKIQAALIVVAASVVKGFNAADYKDRDVLRTEIVKAANDMDDKQWGELSTEAQDWFNEAADAVKAKKVPAEFPDYVAEETGRSRRRAADPEPEPAAKGGETTAVENLEEGQNVKITFKKRGTEKSAAGEVLEVSKRKGFVVVKEADGTEVEIDFDTVTATEVFHGTAAGATDEPEAVLAVGAEVEFTTKRGKTVSGVVKEINEKDNFLVLANGDDYDLDKHVTESMKVLKAAPAAAEPEPTTRRRGAAADDKGGDDKGAAAGKPQRSSNPKGVSVGARIRDLMAQDPDRSLESVGKVLEKEGIEFRPATLEMIHKDCVYFIGKLREEKQMKAGK